MSAVQETAVVADVAKKDGIERDASHQGGGSTAHGEPSVTFSFEFTANAREYFRIWIVNVALTICTLGIYSPWAKVRRLRYFYGCTRLDGTAFQYFANPIAILRGRALALVALGIYWYAKSAFQPQVTLAIIVLMVLFFPWVLVHALAFQARNTAFRNITFSYRGRYIPLAFAFLGWPLLTGVLTLGAFWLQGGDIAAAMAGDAAALANAGTPGWAILVPFSMLLVLPVFLYLQKREVVGNWEFGAAPFAFGAHISDFYKLVFKLLGLFVLGVVLIFIAVALLLMLFRPQSWGMLVLQTAVNLTLLSFLGAAYTVMSRNLVLNATRIGNLRLLSRLKVLEVTGIYFTNVLAIVFSVGLLIPWAQVRMKRYQLAKTVVLADASLDIYRGLPGGSVSAVGEELADAFGLDVSI
jgi:uncharacterized membrane protein YjgN (DUF898 family)